MTAKPLPAVIPLAERRCEVPTVERGCLLCGQVRRVVDGLRLARWRKAAGWTMTRAALTAGWSTERQRQVERGAENVAPSNARVGRLVQALAAIVPLPNGADEPG